MLSKTITRTKICKPHLRQCKTEPVGHDVGDVLQIWCVINHIICYISALVVTEGATTQPQLELMQEYYIKEGRMFRTYFLNNKTN